MNHENEFTRIGSDLAGCRLISEPVRDPALCGARWRASP